MFLSHFSGGPLRDILEMDVEDVFYWYEKAVAVHNAMQPKDEKDGK